MSGRIIEITTPGRSIHKDRGFMEIREDGETIGRVPLDDIDTIIAAAHGLFWSGNILAALAERSVPVVFVGSNFSPVSHILPIASHHNQGAIMQAQAD
ncbi:MAG: CRISPR-associated endonuclease Cas1, partial [Robiginitomaculum sp.]|nr:CRISPR-associated endonuclease Cas1 [Robiginitomaculum sp.]